MLVAGANVRTRRAVADLLAEARSRTLVLVTALPEEALRHPLMQGDRTVMSELERIVAYEAENLLGESPRLAFGSFDEWFDVMTDVRQRVLQQLEELDSGEPSEQQSRYRRVIEHEYQRGESILEVLQDWGNRCHLPQERRVPRGRRLADPGMMVRFPGGDVEIGAPPQASAWPEESPLHHQQLRPFWIDITPVTNGDFMTFMGQGGYADRNLWSEVGWSWLKTSQVQMPGHWSWQDGAWWSRCLGHEQPVDFTRPVTHVSYYEAEAFARFVGKRLPTEREWEAAAGWDPETQSRRQYPWGNMSPTAHVANLDQLALGPAPVGAFPGNISPTGCYGMVGDVWEWTESDFLPYPGAPEWPAEAAESRSNVNPKVLRGGSWATRAGAVRNWSRRAAPPDARHVFAGFRCARDG